MFFSKSRSSSNNFLWAIFGVFGIFFGILFTKNALQSVLQGISAERTRFELVVRNDPYVGLANRWFQPLTHLSGSHLAKLRHRGGLQRYEKNLICKGWQEKSLSPRSDGIPSLSHPFRLFEAEGFDPVLLQAGVHDVGFQLKFCYWIELTRLALGIVSSPQEDGCQAIVEEDLTMADSSSQCGLIHLVVIVL